jgi:hypothetical protein
MFCLVLLFLSISNISKAEGPAWTLRPSVESMPDDSTAGIHSGSDSPTSGPKRRVLPPINPNGFPNPFARSPSSPTSPTAPPTRAKRPRFNTTGTSFPKFVQKRDNFKISKLNMAVRNDALGIKGDGTIDIGTAVGDVKDTCFLIPRASDKVTVAMRKHILKHGGKLEYADNPVQALQGIRRCAARIKHAFRIAFCAHGREGYTTMGLWGLQQIDPTVARMLGEVAKLPYPILDVRFISCQVAGKIDDRVVVQGRVQQAAPFHIMRQIAAAWDTFVLAFDKKLDVNSGSANTEAGANAVVVRLSDKGRRLRNGNSNSRSNDTST